MLKALPRIVVVLALCAVAYIFGRLDTGKPQPTTPTLDTAPIVLDGTGGITNSASFNLTAAQYRLDWQVTGTCGLWLRPVDTRQQAQLLLNRAGDQAAPNGTTYAYPTIAGAYYLMANGCGDWHATLSPVHQ